MTDSGDHLQLDFPSQLARDVAVMLMALPSPVIALDAGLRICVFNRAAAILTGYSPQEAAGRAIWDLLSPQQDSNEVRSMLDKAWQSAGPTDTEVRWVLRDRSLRRVRLRLAKVATGDGDREYLVASGWDVTDERAIGAARDQDEQALRRSEASFRRLIEESPDLVVVHRHGRVVYVNKRGSQHLGYDQPDQLVGTPAIELVHPDDRALAIARIERVVATGQPAPPVEERIVRRDGSTIVAEVAAIPLEFQGEPSIIVVAHDVTARKQAEQDRAALEAKIQHAQKLESLGVLAGGIAHDFNNLLMGVLGNAGLALMQLPPESPARESLQRIEAAGRRAADLTRQLLAYSGKSKFVVEHVDLSRLVQEMIHLLQTVISKRASLHLDLAPNLPVVKADPTQLSQVVMNLITNASDAIGERDGIIRISTGSVVADSDYLRTAFLTNDVEEGAFVFLEVSDTGSGMDAATVHRIFDPFFTTKSTGRGLGLAAVLGIVRGHHGAIKVYSEPGRGTTFKVLLPCLPGADAPAARRPVPVPAPIERACTVLVVDDDDLARSLAERVLTHFGFRVIAAGDGAQGIRALRDHGDDIDVVLLDMTMPVMGGAETFRAMRAIRADLPVVLTSGYNEQDAIDRFSDNGLAGFIQKPYSPAELVQKLRAAMGW